jgi:hypothetical protein
MMRRSWNKNPFGSGHDITSFLIFLNSNCIIDGAEMENAAIIGKKYENKIGN